MHEITPKKSKLTLYIGIALVLGIITGFLLNSEYVGKENLKLANAEALQTTIKNKMKVFETASDTIFFNKLVIQKKEVEVLKMATDKAILNNKDSIPLYNLGLTFKDSINAIEGRISALIDTTSAAYKTLGKQMSLISSQKTEVTKARDKKLEWFTLLADIFLRLIKMIVAPLVFTTLVVGVAKLGDISAVGRIGGKTLLWFLSASLMSLLLGLVLVNFFKPGIAMHLPLPDAGTSSGIDKAALTVKDFFYHV